MKRVTNSLLLGLLLMVLAVAPASAQSGTGLPIADTYVYEVQPTTPQDDLNLWLDATDPVGPVGCTPQGYIYLKWGLDTHTSPVNNAVLTLTTASGTSNAVGQTVTLYQLVDNWDESATWTGRLTLGPVLENHVLPASLPAGTKVKFEDASITTYINQEISGGDGAVSFALAFTTCGPGSQQEFEDSEGGAAVSPRLEAPNAVTLREMSAQQTNSLPLYAGLGALALVAVVGVGLSRRRMAAR